MDRDYHLGVEWDKWEESDDTFTLISNRDYIAVFNFGKRNILVYQLIYQKRNYSVVGTYDKRVDLLNGMCCLMVCSVKLIFY